MSTDDRDTARAGEVVIRAAWITNVVFVIGFAPALFGVDSLDGMATATGLTLFLASLPVWCYALGKAMARSARGDEITVSSLFFLNQSAPTRVRRHLLGATVASVGIAAIMATANPFAVLVPMLPLGLVGLWGARHGTFPPRTVEPSHRR
jgi:hypothetical protein